MIAEIGQFLLILAFLMAIVQAILSLSGAQLRNERFMRAGSTSSLLQFVLLAAAFVCLVQVFLNSDFSVLIVAANGHTQLPTIYKISAAWGQHEGSMLLWALILSLFGAAVGVFGQNLPVTLKARTLGVQGLVGVSFLAFIIFTSNPFNRLFPTPIEGNGFNPLLQDPGLAFHPPTLYLGYVGFSIAYSFSVAALIEGRVDAAWARWVRPWVLASWCFLTLGITAGSLWAYYELGWGGWWFWDPVENASLMPWLIGTALLHSALVVERRHGLVNWTILLSILTFTFSLIGTFLVRSGVLTSVHSFAVDPARGIFILIMILAASGGALTLYAFRASSLRAGPPFAPVSREGGILINNVFLMCATAVVFLGTFYPLVIDALTDDMISVGPPFFNTTFAPLMVGVATLMAFGPLLRWRRDEVKSVSRPVRIPALIAVATGLLVLVLGKSWVGGLGIGTAVFLLGGITVWILQRLRIGTVPLASSFAMMRAFPGATWGLLIAHTGFAVTMIGVTAMSAWETQKSEAMSQGDTATLGAYTFTLTDTNLSNGPNYRSEQLVFDVTRGGRPDGQILTERRFYPENQSFTTEAGIRADFLGNVFVAYGRTDEDGRYAVRISQHPFAGWIWVGGILIAAGGFVSLSDRRFRVGAPHKVRAHSSSTSEPA